MSLDRKDVRAKLDDSDHAKLVAICRLDGVEISEFIEGLIVPVIRKRIADAIALAKEFPSEGISGNGWE